MSVVSFKAPAKLNLTLDVFQLKEDKSNLQTRKNYHFLEMLTQTIDLFDEIEISKTKTAKINIFSSGVQIPLGSENIIYKTILKFIEKTQIDFTGIDVKISKRIPVQAGMGGGSSDAAMTLLALNKLHQANLSSEDLKKLGLKLGADVPLFLSGGTCFCQGIGEKITQLPSLKDVEKKLGLDISFLVVKPKLGFSTAEIYRRFDLIDLKKRPDTSKILQEFSNFQEICSKNSKKNNFNINNIFSSMYNVLEEAIDKTCSQNLQIFEIKEKLISLGAVVAQMTGSGSAVFGVFLNRADAEKSFEILKKNHKKNHNQENHENYESVFLCKPISSQDYLNLI